MPASGAKVEIEFMFGVWVDVTADVDWAQGVNVNVGRTSPLQAAATSSMSVALRNDKGKYTPGLQVLSDGTPAPYYPYVLPRRRIRYSTSAGVRFLGYIQSWSPTLDNGFLGRCQVQATDIFDQLSRVTMRSPIGQEVMIDQPSAWWPMTDGGPIAVEQSGAQLSALSIYNVAAAGLSFGDNGPGSGDGSGVKFAPSSASAGQYLYGQTRIPLADCTIEVWVNAGTTLPAWTTQTVVGLFDANDVINATISLESGKPAVAWAGAAPAFGSITETLTASATINDGGWHLLAITVTASGVLRLWVDGVAVAATTTTPVSTTARTVYVGDSGTGGVRFQGNVAQLAIYNTVLSAGRLQTHFSAGMGWYGETVDQRIARFLSYANIYTGDYNLDPSTVVCNTYPQGGKDVLSACQDMSVTEGSGAAFYVLAGAARFANRSFRKPGPPAMTLDAVTMIDRGTFQPSSDSQTLANSVTALRSAASGTLATFTASDDTSINTFGQYTGSDVATYTILDSDAQDLAQQIVAQNRTPGYRLPQISVDLLTATTSLYADLQTVEIGSRLRLTNMPAAASPATTVDVIAEGWTEVATRDQYLVTFDASPADNPADFVWDDTTYGLWQAQALYLASDITSTATTLVVTSTRTNLLSNPSFEVNTTGWAVGGVPAPTIVRSADRSVSPRGYTSGWSGKVTSTGPETFLPNVSSTFSTSVGATYTVSAWVYVTNGSAKVTLGVGGIGFGTNTGNKVDQWVRLSMTFIATGSSHTAAFYMNSAAAGEVFYIDAALAEASGQVNYYIEGSVTPTDIPLFTQNSGQYPLLIQVAGELIGLNSAPASGSSPQTFTGVTRGVNGTAKAAHTAGTSISLAPAATWTL